MLDWLSQFLTSSLTGVAEFVAVAWREFTELSALQKLIAIATLCSLIGVPSALAWYWRRRSGDPQLQQIHATIHEMARRIAEMQAAQSKSPVSGEAQARAAERIEEAATNIAQSTDQRSKRAFELLEKGDTRGAKKLLGEVLEMKAREGAAANKEAAQAARNIAAFTRLQNVGEAADLYARAAELDAENLENWIDLGDTAIEAGRLAEARRAFSAALELADQRQDVWWGMTARNRLGNVAVDEGNLQEALDLFEEGKSRAERLAQADPKNAGWQRDLSVAQEKIGDELRAKGNLGDALAAYQADLAIAERLAQADPKNAGWQRDLSVSHDRIGDVLRAQGNLGDALAAFKASLAIRDRLAAADPANAGWQRDLAVSNERVGDMHANFGDEKQAREAFERALGIYQALAARNPDDVPSEVNSVVPRLRLAELDPTQAKKHLRSALDILKPLAAQHRLDAMRTGWIAAIEAQLAALEAEQPA